jgi:hypothetical protein
MISRYEIFKGSKDIKFNSKASKEQMDYMVTFRDMMIRGGGDYLCT